MDVEEYERHRRQMNYSPEIDHILKENVKILVDWINNERGPFSKEYVDIWYNRYHQLKNSPSGLFLFNHQSSHAGDKQPFQVEKRYC